MDVQQPAKYKPHDRVQWTMATGKLKRGTVTSVSRGEPWIYVVLDDETLASLGVCEFQLSRVPRLPLTR